MSSFWDDFERVDRIFGYFRAHRALFPLDVWKIGRSLGIEIVSKTKGINSLEVVRTGLKMVIRYNKSDEKIEETARFLLACGIAELLLDERDFDKKFFILDQKSQSVAYAMDMLMPGSVFRKVFGGGLWDAFVELFQKRKAGQGQFERVAREFGVTEKLAEIRFSQVYNQG